MQLIAKSLYYQAIADAVGYEFEFHLNPDPAKVFATYRAGPLRITDDTQMTLFGLEALCKVEPGSMPSLRYELTEGYHRWFQTQHRGWDSREGRLFGGLMDFEVLWYARAPGNACMQGAGDRKPREGAKGCGGVMRMMPFLFAGAKNLPVSEACLASSRATHVSPIADEAAALYCDFARLIMSGDRAATEALFRREVIGLNGEYPEHIRDIGGGWTAIECVLMAVYAYLNAEGFPSLLQIAICHPGDSDSVAAVAGAFWGLCPNSDEPSPGLIARLEERGAIDYVLKQWEAACANPQRPELALETAGISG